MIMPIDASTMTPGMPTVPGTPATPGAGGPVSPMVTPQTAMPSAFNVPPIGGRVGMPNPGVSSIGAPTGPVLPPQVMAALQQMMQQRAGMLNRSPVPGMFAQGQGGGSVTPPSPLISVAQNIRRLPTPMLSGMTS